MEKKKILNRFTVQDLVLIIPYEHQYLLRTLAISRVNQGNQERNTQYLPYRLRGLNGRNKLVEHFVPEELASKE